MIDRLKLTLDRNRTILLVCLVLVGVTTVVFLQVRNYEFLVYDDGGYAKNPHVVSGLTINNVAWAFQTMEMANWHPLTWLSYMLDGQLFRVNPGWSHLVNLFLHLLNTLLVFWVWHRMTRAVWPSAFVAALFAWHPLHVESVAWIAERKDVLSTFFWMLTLVAYVRYVEHPKTSRYALALLLFALGLMAKPMLVSLPLVLLLLDFWPLRRLETTTEPAAQAARLRTTAGQLLREKVPFLIFSFFASFMTFLAQRNVGAMMGGKALPLSIRAGNAVSSYLNYIGKMIWPSGLAVPYPYPRTLALSMVAITGLVLIILSIGVFRQARIRPYLCTGWFWYLLTLAPVIGLLQVGEQAMADRYTYIPLIGLFVMVAWGAEDLTSGWARRPRGLALGAGGAVILLALLIVTRIQLAHWKNSEALFRHTLEVTRNNPIAHFNLGFTLAEHGRLKEAAEQYSKAVELRPSFSEAQNNWGLALMSLGRLDEAIEHYRAALRAQPAYPLALANLGEALSSKGLLQEAIDHLNRATEMDPGYAEAHYQLALALAKAGQIQHAIREYGQAVRLQPTMVNALNNLAWLLATCPDPAYRNGAEAVRLAEWACKLTRGKQAFLLGTLGAAYAEAGRFADAASAAEQASQLAATVGQKEVATTNQKLLQFYKAGRAYHEGEKL